MSKNPYKEGDERYEEFSIKGFPIKCLKVLLLGQFLFLIYEVLRFLIGYETIDIQLHDTYLVISRYMLPTLLLVISLIIYAYYNFTKPKYKSLWLSLGQIYSYILGIGLLIMAYYSGYKSLSKRNYIFHNFGDTTVLDTSTVLKVSILILTLSLLLFTLNVFYSIISRLIKPKAHTS